MSGISNEKIANLYGLEFGFEFINMECQIARFRSESVLLMKLPISHCRARLVDLGYPLEVE